MSKANTIINKKLYKDTDGSLARLTRQLRLLDIVYEKNLQKLQSTYSENSKDFLDLCNKLNDIRKNEDLKVNKEIGDIEKNVTDLTDVFKDNSQLEKADEEDLCKQVVNTSRHIFTMKDSLQLELKQLQSQENKMIHELNMKYKEIDEFAGRHGHKNTLLKHRLKETNHANKYSSHQCQEVKNFQKFLDETGGHYGGWRLEDHLLFLKISGKHKPHQTAEIIHQHLPDKKLDDVLDHAEWYNKYMNLRKAKKKAIEDWKGKHKQNLRHSNKSDGELKATIFKRDPNEKHKIEQWKIEQQLKKDSEIEEIKLKQILKQKEEKEKKQKLEHQRSIINSCKKERLDNEIAVASAHKQQEMQEAHRKAMEANRNLKQFRLEDRKYTERIKARRTSMKSEDEVSVKSSVQAERDPARLLQPTQVWIERTKKINHVEEEEHCKPTQPLYILKVPHLGKPAWRKGLES